MPDTEMSDMALTRPRIIIGEEVVIPDTVVDFQSFRDWTVSEEFPQRGRIDYLDDTIEVDMSPEDLQRHGVLKTCLVACIWGLVNTANLGQVFTDCTRVVHPDVGLSCEPDIVYVSWDALRTGRVRYIESSRDKLMEVEGAPTLVVEIVSDSSVQKDLTRLPPLYARAGIEELWLLDARSAELRFDISHSDGDAWSPGAPDADGFLTSRVLGRRLRLRREPGELPRTWRYSVDEAPC